MASQRQPDFFLASTEGYDLDAPRRGWRLREVSIEEGHALLIRTEPPVLRGQNSAGMSFPTGLVLVSPRHRDVSLSRITVWPVYGYVAIPIVRNAKEKTSFMLEEIKVIAWGELYDTEEAAREKRM